MGAAPNREDGAPPRLLDRQPRGGCLGPSSPAVAGPRPGPPSRLPRRRGSSAPIERASESLGPLIRLDADTARDALDLDAACVREAPRRALPLRVGGRPRALGAPLLPPPTALARAAYAPSCMMPVPPSTQTVFVGQLVEQRRGRGTRRARCRGSGATPRSRLSRVVASRWLVGSSSARTSGSAASAAGEFLPALSFTGGQGLPARHLIRIEAEPSQPAHRRLGRSPPRRVDSFRLVVDALFAQPDDASAGLVTTAPPDGCSSAITSRSSVVLPAPLGPTIPVQPTPRWRLTFLAPLRGPS